MSPAPPGRPRPLARLAALALPLPAALALAWLAPGAAGCGGPSATPSSGDPTSPEACAECHAEVVAEWRESAHARAWTSETFQAAARPECAGCHAPDLIVRTTPAPPPARDHRRESGVDCQACHMDDAGALVGPFQPDEKRLLSAHAVRKDYFLYRTSQLCGTCHQTTLAETERWGPQLGGVQPRCQECHMPAVERHLTQGGGLLRRAETALTTPRTQRRHSFGLPASGPWGGDPVEVEWGLTRAPGEGGEVAARVSLRSLVPHGLPTGELDHGAYRALLVARDAAGVEIGRLERVLRRADGGELTPGAPLTLEGRFGAATRQLELELRRESPHPRQILQTVRAVD